MQKIGLLLGLLLGLGSTAIAQSTKEIALAKARQAIELMDAGKTQESVALLEEAHQLDPSDYNYSYELALAHYMQKDYAIAVAQLEPLLSHPRTSERTYQLLGNSYDMARKPEQAKATYENGLRKFPGSGPLYLESGNLELGQKNYAAALDFYEKGIELAPAFPSNYYRAALLYLSSSQKHWGMLYGELFMNLERNTARTAEISKLLYDTYKSGIEIKDKNSYELHFSQTVIDASTLQKGKKLKLPYGMTYETTLGVAVAGQEAINLASLNIIRSGFIDTYYAMKRNAEYPNVLFEYERSIAKAGHQEAYNYWILMKGDEVSFREWYKQNEPKYQALAGWFKENPLTLDARHKFYSAQY